VTVSSLQSNPLRIQRNDDDDGGDDGNDDDDGDDNGNGGDGDDGDDAGCIQANPTRKPELYTVDHHMQVQEEHTNETC
jgi:hypothetical protein